MNRLNLIKVFTNVWLFFQMNSFQSFMRFNSKTQVISVILKKKKTMDNFLSRDYVPEPTGRITPHSLNIVSEPALPSPLSAFGFFPTSSL